MMQKFLLVCTLCCTGLSFAATPEKAFTLHKDCAVNPNIQRHPLPPTPNNMSLPSFGQGIIGWATGPEGAEHKLNTVKKTDIENYKKQGVTLEMLQKWQAFYENETKRNSCNPTAPLRAELMKKIISLWNDKLI